MLRIRQVVPLTGYKVRLILTNGEARVVNLKPLMRGPIFAPMRRKLKTFRAVHVNVELGTLAWPNGADLCPDVLIYGRKPAWSERRARRGLGENKQAVTSRRSSERCS